MPNETNNFAFPTPRPVATGNLLVLKKPKTKASRAVKKLEGASGMKMAVTRELGSKTDAFKEALEQADGLYMDHLHVALLKPQKGANTMALSAALSGSSDVQMVRPELYMYTYSSLQQRYDAWVREGLKMLADGSPGLSGPGVSSQALAQKVTGLNSTWGVSAVRADQSPFTGRGIKVAVLDTGFDLGHDDFAGRSITKMSFVPGEDVQDVQGHGTHCIGTSCGPSAGEIHPHYGVATEADIFVGKVLNNSGSGRESWILAGMEWAIENGCEVISMSLGRGTQVGELPDPLYEAVGNAALENGSLIIAAAGNESARQFGFVAPVGAPANSPSIMAVGAIDSDMQVANFSCGGINDNGGEVNICAPGVDVFSSVPLPRRYDRFSGTSMATPHVAGIAAQLAHSDATLRGHALWDALRRTALDIGLPVSDGGAGLAQSPLSAPTHYGGPNS